MALFLRRAFHLQTLEAWNFPRIGIRELYCPGVGRQDGQIDCSALKGFQYRSFDVFIPKAAQTEGCRLLQDCGLDTGGKYVCLHVRESGYRRDSGRREYRNAQIRHYVEGVSLLVDSGYQVVRLGDESMMPFPAR